MIKENEKSTSLSLYGITNEIEALGSMLMDDEGEITEDHEELEAAIMNALTTKADGCVGFVQREKDLIIAAKARIEGLRDFIKVHENRMAAFDRNVAQCMKLLGHSKLKGITSTITIRKPSKVLFIEDQKFVPNQFLTVKSEVKVDKAELKKFVKDNEVKGVRLVDSEKISIIYK
jgi:hypothetical protein